MKHIPKAELHRHLELSLRDSTIKELAPQFGFDLSKKGAFEHHFKIIEPMKDLGSVLHKFLDTQKILATNEILERIAYEACEDAFNEGIKILELRYAPTFVALNHLNLSFQGIHNAFVKGAKRAEKNFPMAVGFIGILQRTLPVKENLNVVDFIIENKQTFIGIDLADNEVGFNPGPFAPCFKKAKKAGLKITVHAGEALEENSERNIIDSTKKLFAQRIGHGIQCHRSPDVLKFVVENKIPLEICPTSNILTGAVKDIYEHPIKKLLASGVWVTLSSDDPGIFNQNTNQEYELLSSIGIDKKTLLQCSHRGAQSSFIPKVKKQKVWPYNLDSLAEEI